jgi:DNA-binding NtrC family response regulator
MTKILVVDDDAMICDVVAGCFEDLPDTEVQCALRGDVGAQKIQAEHFDLALIDGTLPEISGLGLAAVAANENTPALVLAGHPETIEQLDRFGYPYLAKPFSLERLLSESVRVMADASENIRRIKASVTSMQAGVADLKATLAETRRLVDRLSDS